MDAVRSKEKRFLVEKSIAILLRIFSAFDVFGLPLNINQQLKYCL